MLEQYSGENRGLRNLDAALRDAVQMVQVSDQRITYLRKMHALLLLRKCATPPPPRWPPAWALQLCTEQRWLLASSHHELNSAGFLHLLSMSITSSAFHTQCSRNQCSFAAFRMLTAKLSAQAEGGAAIVR